MTLTGKDAEQFADQVSERVKRIHAEQLAAAKARAAERGKEPFDLAKLETMCDTSHDGRLDPVEVRQAEFETRYYVHFPDVMTLAEFAKVVAALSLE
jgi:Tfp pilus assembly protein PilP